MDEKIQIRQAKPEDAGGIASAHVASWQTSYVSLVADEVLKNLSVEKRAKWWGENLSNPLENTIVYVAENAQGEIVGFVSGGPVREKNDKYTGEIYAIYLIQEFQGQGIGKALTLQMVESLLDFGFDSMLIWVLAENDSRGFYEKLGGAPVAKKEFEIGDRVMDGIGYGWEDIRTLLE